MRLQTATANSGVTGAGSLVMAVIVLYNHSLAGSNPITPEQMAIITAGVMWGVRAFQGFARKKGWI